MTVIIITIKVIKIVAIFMSGWLPSHALTCRAVSNQTDTYEYHILVQPPCCHLIFSVISLSTTIVQSNLFFGKYLSSRKFQFGYDHQDMCSIRLEMGAQADGRVSVCFSLNISRSRRCLYLSYIYPRRTSIGKI